MIRVTGTLLTPIQQVKTKIEAEKKRLEKAHSTSVKVEGFRLMRVLRKEIRSAAPGGRRFKPLSLIRRTMGATRRGTLRTDIPLRALARAIGYEVQGESSFSLKIGFVGRASSTTWRELARIHQEGFERSPEDPYFYKSSQPVTIREQLAKRGSEFGARFGKSRSRRRAVFFLRKTTTRLKTPARPIIDPFWRTHETEAAINIRSNFRRKARGERI